MKIVRGKEIKKKNNRNLIFIGITILALVLTAGSFAYTYPGFATASLGATAHDEPFITHELSADQPLWDDILPQRLYYSEYLLPNAYGDDTELPTQHPEEGEHWDKVDDLYADDYGTYVSTLSSKHWERDLYNLSNPIMYTGQETILSVTVYFRFAAAGDYNALAMAAIKTNGEVHEGPNEVHLGNLFETKSYRWVTNPATEDPWTFEEINDLQAGITIRGADKYQPALCTQVTVCVDYEYVIIEGEVPAGNLYDITPHPDYTGDLMVKLYITNTRDLLKAYQYLNMKVYVYGSLEAEKDPDYQVLSIENGVIIFNIDGGSAPTYTIEIVGGGYRVLSADTEDWAEGWSIIPEFYCEVTQR